MAKHIPLSTPHMSDEGFELEYIHDAFNKNWIAPLGENVNEFEKVVGSYMGAGHPVALSTGTATLHLSMILAGVKSGDMVFCQDLTFSASANPVTYVGAEPVFIDSDWETWNMDPAALEKAFALYGAPKAVVVVHLYGNPAKMDEICAICDKHNVPLIEDAAEALGSEYRGKKCGTFGDVGIFSFNGNKIITTSGGGMVLANNQLAIEKMRFWSTQAREPEVWYEHKEYGYNYRMSNICAAIGLGQLEILPEKLRLRKNIHQRYKELLSELPVRIKGVAEKGSSNYWLNLLTIDSDTVTPLDVVTKLQNAEIESRPTWKPMHMQPLFAKAVYVTDETVYENGCTEAGVENSVSERVFATTLCLPSGEALTEEQLLLITNEIRACFA